MQIKARKEDWRPDHPSIRPLTWAAPIFLLGLLVFGAMSLTGSMVNSDQQALLNHLGTEPK